MDNRRLILLVVFLISLYMLWTEWQRYRNPPAPVAAASAGAASATADTPQVSGQLAAAVAGASAGELTPGAVPAPAAATAGAEPIRVRTDKLVADISPVGGDIVRLELLEHRSTAEARENLLLVDPAHRYTVQSGLIGSGLPNHRSPYRVLTSEREPGADGKLVVILEAAADGPVVVRKRYEFTRGEYLAKLTHSVENRGGEALAAHAYFQFQRDGQTPAGESSMTMTFTGPAVFTDKDKFRKITFDEIASGSAKYPTLASDGWLALVQHYFVAAWLPESGTPREYFMRKLEPNLFAAGVILPLPAATPGATAELAMPLYLGPQAQATLEKLAPGLDLVVDYGWLTVVAAPLFWLLDFIHGFVGNWGWAIVVLTILIKLAFFPLSAASYKSMARMRQVTPRMMQIKERYADDRQKMNQEMMELYRKEKINPLGGCLPILIQIPVFIALYWVLLGAVEMRGAPWVLWIDDLSRADPYYVLPVIMVVTMIIQMKLNPTPPDPIQAKIMMAMPFVFGVMFFFFPAGLVLYWVVNNILSIAQQWQITRVIEGAAKSAAR